MKKLLLILILFPAIVFAGDLEKKALKQKSAVSLLSEKEITVPTYANDICNDEVVESSMADAEGSIILGSAGNLYTILRSTSNMVAAEQDCNTVVFIHRNDPAVGNPTPNSTSQYRYDISTDGGSSFTTNIGPLNLFSDNSAGDNTHARYPQVSIYNPAGNTDPNNAYLVYMGATHNGSGGNDTWDGNVNGVARLDGDVSTITENPTVINNGDALIPNHLVEGLPGEFWAGDFQYDGNETYDIIAYRGVFNGSDIDWATSFVDPMHDVTNTDDGLNAAANVSFAFSDDGMTGYMTFIGDSGVEGCGNPVLEPIYWYTEDGGDTWDGPRTVDVAGFDGFFDDLIENLEFEDGTTVSTVPTLGYTYDVVVDANGDLHLGCSVFSAFADATTGEITPYNFFVGSGFFVDIIISGDDEQHEALGLSNILARESAVITNTFTNDSRMQLSKSADSEKIFFTFLDSTDVAGDPAVAYRDLWGMGYDINTGLATDVVNFTTDNTQWGGLAYYLTSAPQALTSGTTYSIPCVFTEIPIDDLSAVYFHYFQDATFDESDFVNDIDRATHIESLPNGTDLTFEENGLNYTFTINGASNFCGVIWDFGDGSTEVSDGTSVSHFFPNTDASYTITGFLTNQDGQVAFSVTITVESVVDTDGPIIVLNGGEEVTVEAQLGGSWDNLGPEINGFSASDNVDPDVVVTVTGEVDLETVGVYTLTYTATDLAGNPTTVVQTITVSDTTAPFIIYNGPTTFNVACGGTLPEPPVFANDTYEGNLTDNMVIVGLADIDVNCNAENTVTYNVSDASGNAADELVLTYVVSGCDDSVPCGDGVTNVGSGFISILPNPTQGNIQVTIDGIDINGAVVSVYNLQGKLMQEARVNAATVNLDLSVYTTGVYLVNVQTAEGVVTEKVVLNK